jgi:hypothetical protein
MSDIIARFRDFYNGEIVDIPWSCALETPSIRIWHIMTDFLDMRPLVRLQELMTFADGSTIEETPKIYSETNWELEETSNNFEESSHPIIFLITMILLSSAAVVAAIGGLYYNWNRSTRFTQDIEKVNTMSRSAMDSSIESNQPMAMPVSGDTDNSVFIQEAEITELVAGTFDTSVIDDCTTTDQPCNDITTSMPEENTEANQPCSKADHSPPIADRYAGMVKTGGGYN